MYDLRDYPLIFFYDRRIDYRTKVLPVAVKNVLFDEIYPGYYIGFVAFYEQATTARLKKVLIINNWFKNYHQTILHGFEIKLSDSFIFVFFYEKEDLIRFSLEMV